MHTLYVLLLTAAAVVAQLTVGALWLALMCAALGAVAYAVAAIACVPVFMLRALGILRRP